MTDITKGAAFSIACSAAVGLHIVFSKLALAKTNPTTCVTYLITFALGFSMVGARGYRWRRLPRQARGSVILHSLLALTGIVFTWLGLSELNATVATFISRTEVLVSIAFAVALLNERLTAKRVIGFSIGMVGVLVMSWPAGGATTWWQPGLVYMLIAAFGFGSCEIFGKKAITHLPIPVFMLIRNAIICALLWLYLLVTAAPFAVDPVSLVYIAISALLGPVLARYFFMHSLQHLALSVSVGLNQTQPIFAAIFGVAAGLALPSATQWLGGLIIVGGCLCLLSRPKKVPAMALQS